MATGFLPFNPPALRSTAHFLHFNRTPFNGGSTDITPFLPKPAAAAALTHPLISPANSMAHPHFVSMTSRRSFALAAAKWNTNDVTLASEMYPALEKALTAHTNAVTAFTKAQEEYDKALRNKDLPLEDFFAAQEEKRLKEENKKVTQKALNREAKSHMPLYYEYLRESRKDPPPRGVGPVGDKDSAGKGENVDGREGGKDGVDVNGGNGGKDGVDVNGGEGGKDAVDVDGKKDAVDPDGEGGKDAVDVNGKKDAVDPDGGDGKGDGDGGNGGDGKGDGIGGKEDGGNGEGSTEDDKGGDGA